MTPQEKTAKIADLERQLRKIRRTIKGLNLSHRGSALVAFNLAIRVVGLVTASAVLRNQLLLLQSQKTT